MNGAKQKIEKMIESYGKLVFSICYKMTSDYFAAEDLTQETFLSVYGNLDAFGGENEKAWICKIASNKCLDYLKKAERRSIPTEKEYFLEMAKKEASPEEKYVEGEERERILALCRSLKPPYGEIAEYYYYKGMGVEEISKRLGRNKKTVQTQIYRAKALLRKIYRREE